MADCDFENTYIELEQHLRRITNLPDWAGVVALYEKTLPSFRAADIETLRKYRNNVFGHGRKVGGSSPIVPQAWVDCLRAEIDYIKQNESQVAGEVIAVFRKMNSVSFSSALERIFNNRKNDKELTDSFLVYSKLGDICGASFKSKKIILHYYEIDKRLHLFQSIMMDGQDLHGYYHEVEDITTKKEFLEIIDVVENLVKKEKGENIYKTTIDEVEMIFKKEQSGSSFRSSLYWEAVRLVAVEQKASISFLQRNFSIGYVRAGNIIEQMEKDGFVGAFDGENPRKVLITESEYRKMHGKVSNNPINVKLPLSGVIVRDPKYWEALKYAVIEKEITMSFLMRKLNIGYETAGEIIEELVEDGFIRKRWFGLGWKVRLTEKGYKEKYGELRL